MATYTLAVGAREEHTHQDETFTELLWGSADLIMRGRRLELRKGTPVRVPANTLHIVVNTGYEESGCRCHCG